jgi:tetratricopeptide (TPR) repeat protein
VLTELLEYRFSSSLAFPVAHELHLLTGMLIADTGNPNKDTPGSGRVAGSVYLTLERGEEPEEWYLSTFTHDIAGADLPEVAQLRTRLHLVLTALTRNVTELFVSPALPDVQPLLDHDRLVKFGDAMARAERYDRAVVEYTLALALAPSDTDVLLKRAVCLRRLGDIGDTLIDYTRAIALAPHSAQLYAMRASVYADVGRHLEALADLQQAQKLEPTNPDHHVKAGLIYYERESYASAVDAFTIALSVRPADADCYYYRGCAEFQLHHVEQAADDFAQAERLSATLAKVQIADVLVNRVAALVRTTKRDALDEASTAVTRLLEMGVPDPPAALLYLWRADIQQRQGKSLSALADCDQALALAPADSRTYNVKGIVLAGMGQFGDALAAFSQAALLTPDALIYLHNRAITLGRMERYDAALVEYTRAILLDPHRAHLYSERGEMYAALAQTGLAEADFRRALALAPDDLPTMLRLGALLGKQGDLPAAMGYLDRVIERDTGELRQIAQAQRNELYQQSRPGQATAPILLPPYGAMHDGAPDTLGLKVLAAAA